MNEAFIQSCRMELTRDGLSCIVIWSFIRTILSFFLPFEMNEISQPEESELPEIEWPTLVLRQQAVDIRRHKYWKKVVPR